MRQPLLSVTRPTALALGVAMLVTACAAGDPALQGVTVTTTTTEAPATVTDDGPSESSAEDTTEGTTEEGLEAVQDEPVESVVNREPDPIPVTFVTDSDRSATATIGTDGGDITTTGTEGTDYRLVVPAGALTGDQDITITPITLDSSPLEGASLRGLAMEPDGLVFFEPATLEISAPSDGGLDVIGFQGTLAEDDFGPQVAALSDVVSIQVSHFSTGGWVAASEAEIERIYDEFTPGTREGQYVQEIAVINRRVEDPAERGKALGKVMYDWFDRIMAESDFATDPATVEDLIGEFINARDFLSLLREDNEIPSDVDSIMREAAIGLSRAARKVFDEANLACIRDRDPDQFFDMLKWALVLQFLSQYSTEPEPLEGLGVALTQCARFRVEFTSAVKLEGMSSQVTGEVPLELEGDADDLLALNELSFPAIDAVFNGEAVAQTLSCGTSMATQTRVNIPFSGAVGNLADADLQIPTVAIRFEQSNWQCGAASLGPSLWLPWFVTGYPDKSLGDGFYLFNPGLTDSTGVWAEESGNANYTAEGVQVFVSHDVKLIHDPGLP